MEIKEGSRGYCLGELLTIDEYVESIYERTGRRVTAQAIRARTQLKPHLIDWIRWGGSILIIDNEKNNSFVPRMANKKQK